MTRAMANGRVMLNLRILISYDLYPMSTEPEENISDILLSIFEAEVYMTDHEDPVENHRQWNYPQDPDFQQTTGLTWTVSPVHREDEAAEEGDAVADGGVVPDPVGEGQEEDNDDGHVSVAVKRYHPVH